MNAENELRINAVVTICDKRRAAFSKIGPQGKNSLDRIIQAGCGVRRENLSIDSINNPITMDTLAIPIRICYEDEINLICSDWCTYGAPIKELNYDSIPRWWPIEWVYTSPGVLPKTIEFDLGKLGDVHIILDCTVVQKISNEVLNTVFADIFIEGVDDQNLITFDRQPTNEKDKFDENIVPGDIVGGETMFGKKKTTPTDEVVIEEEKKSEISKILETSEQINESETETKTNIIDMEEEKMSEETKETKETTVTETNKKCCKKMPMWLKITGAVIIVAGAAAGTKLIIDKVKSGGSESKK